MNERIVALDVGDRRIGIAVSDALGITAQPIETYTRVGYGPDVRRICQIAQQYETNRILCGLPLNMDGTEQPLTARARKFANRIHGRFGITVTLHDERLSTVEARSGLFEQGGYRALNKGKVDSASAVIILESYFEQGY